MTRSNIRYGDGGVGDGGGIGGVGVGGVAGVGRRGLRDVLADGWIWLRPRGSEFGGGVSAICHGNAH